MFLVIPYKHENLVLRGLPWITFGLIAVNVLIFLLTFPKSPDQTEIAGGLESFYKYYEEHPYLEIPSNIREVMSGSELTKLDDLSKSAIPAGVTEQQQRLQQQTLSNLADAVIRSLEQSPVWRYGHRSSDPYLASFFTSMFLHTGLVHLLGNILFLYLTGCCIEYLWGRPLYLCFYLSMGILAAVMNDVAHPQSGLPLAGASGAIAGLMGAFMIRFYKTKINFVYVTATFHTGKFQLPAWVVLPFWLVQQLLLGTILGNVAVVAYVAHVGGFVFGAVFAFGLDLFRFEEKYVNTFVQHQIGVQENSLYLQALELSQKSEFVKSRDLLRQVVAREPDHMEAITELRRIADLNNQEEEYHLYTGWLLEALIRKRQHDSILEFYRQSQTNRVRLPARTLFAMGNYHEQLSDFRSALDVYQKLVDHHPNDPLAMKAYSKMARLCLEKFGDRRRGTELLENAYRQSKNDEWRAVLKSDFLKYGIPVPDVIQKTAPSPAPMPMFQASPQAMEIHQILPEEPSEIELPNSVFEGQKRGWNPVNCLLMKLADSGVILKNQREMLGILKWHQFRALAVGRIRVVPPGATKPEKDLLVLDFLPKILPGPEMPLYRIYSNQINLKNLFPAEGSSMSAFKKMIEFVLENSLTNCFPSRDQCAGPEFRVFPGVNQYEEELKAKINAHEI